MLTGVDCAIEPFDVARGGVVVTRKYSLQCAAIDWRRGQAILTNQKFVVRGSRFTVATPT